MRRLFGRGPNFWAIWKDVNSRSLWVIWALTSFVVAISGPFGTFAARPFYWRITYWGILIAVSIVVAISIRTVWRNFQGGGPTRYEDFVVSVGLALVFGPFIVRLNRSLIGPDVDGTMGYPAAMGLVLAIAGCTTLVCRFLQETPNAQKAESGRDRLLQRLPAGNGARLARVYSDNHHIRVVTDDGEEHRLLMRMRDAVSEIDMEPGICVHRSHWVATATITKVAQADGREVVQLDCGAHVPIGPKYRRNLIDAGVISD